MKNLFAIIVLQLAILPLIAQNDIRWKKIDGNKDKYDFKYFIKATDSVYKAVFTIPHNKPFQATKHSIFIRNYNSDLSKYTETGIPPESPVTLSLSGFRDYNIISGSMDDNSNPMSQYAKDNRIVITDNNINPLITKDFPLHGKRHKFSGSPSTILSYDSLYLIVINYEIQNPDKPSMKKAPIMRYINVFDKDLALVWNDSVDFDQIFGEKLELGGADFDFVNNKLVITASCNADGFKKVKAALFVVLFDRPQSYKIILNEIFPYDDFTYSRLITKSGNIIFSGTNQMNSSAPFSKVKRKLFYLNKDLNSPDAEPIMKTYEIDNNFASKYPEYKQWLVESLRGPFELFYIDNNLIYCSEYRYYSTSSSSTSSSTTYYFKHITLINMDSDGNIEWLKMINKSTASKQGSYEHYCKAFNIGKNLCIFYYDYADNIAGAKFIEKPRFVGDDKLWIAKAIVTPDGEINKSMITNIGANNVRANLSNTEKVTNNRFLMIGKGTTLPTLSEYYYGFYDIE